MFDFSLKYTNKTFISSCGMPIVNELKTRLKDTLKY